MERLKKYRDILCEVDDRLTPAYIDKMLLRFQINPHKYIINIIPDYHTNIFEFKREFKFEYYTFYMNEKKLLKLLRKKKLDNLKK